MAFLKQQSFVVMDQLGNSPDLNLVENLSGIMKSNLKKKCNISSLPHLIRAIKKLWVNMPNSLKLKLAHSMQPGPSCVWKAMVRG
jgi:hypothetical protein